MFSCHDGGPTFIRRQQVRQTRSVATYLKQIHCIGLLSFGSRRRRLSPKGRRRGRGEKGKKGEGEKGRALAIPLAWFPRLFHATPTERANWRWIGGGIGMHWPDLDEDISVEDLILGRPSGESQAFLRRWLEGRTTKKETTDLPD